MPNKIPTLDDVIEYAKQLNALDKIRLVEVLIPDVKATIADVPPKALKSPYGTFADLGTAPSAEDIEETRREMLRNFPRSDIA